MESTEVTELIFFSLLALRVLRGYMKVGLSNISLFLNYSPRRQKLYGTKRKAG